MEISGKGKQMTTLKKNNYRIAIVLSAFIVLLSGIGVSYGAKKPAPKPADKQKSGQLKKQNRQKVNRFLKRVEKNNPKRAARLRRLRKNNPAKFKQKVHKALRGRARNSEAQTKKASKQNGRRGGQFASAGWRRGGQSRGERPGRMGWRRGDPGRGEWPGRMGWRRGDRNRGRQFEGAKHLQHDESDIWGDDD